MQRGGESRNKSATEAYKSVCKEKQKKVARAGETKPLLFLCVKGWRTEWGEEGGREEQRGGRLWWQRTMMTMSLLPGLDCLVDIEPGNQEDL